MHAVTVLANYSSSLEQDSALVQAHVQVHPELMLEPVSDVSSPINVSLACSLLLVAAVLSAWLLREQPESGIRRFRPAAWHCSH